MNIESDKKLSLDVASFLIKLEKFLLYRWTGMVLREFSVYFPSMDKEELNVQKQKQVWR